MFEGREWHAAPEASPENLDELGRLAPIALPDTYVRLLSYSGGGEGPLPFDPFNLCLDASEEIIESIRTANPGREAFEGFLIFGGNGGGEYIAFDARHGSEPWPIVMIDMIAGADSARVISPDFDAFIDVVGLQAPES